MTKPISSYKVSPARQVAFEILRRVLVEEAFAANLLASNLTKNLSSLDRALAQEITLGVLRHQKYIDFSLEKASNRNLAKLDLEVLIALRIGFYQIHYLTRIPTHAIVNDSVNLVKLSKKTSASGLVNAVLRKMARALEVEQIAKIDNYQQLALIHSHPDWLVKRWVERYGITWTTSLAEANNRPPLVYFRVNPLKISTEALLEKLTRVGLTITISDLIKGAFLVTSGNLELLLNFAIEGLIYIQDAASQLVAQLVDAKAGMTVFDACAAPGGKTTAIAAQMNNQGLIIAGDLHLARVKIIKENAVKLGVKIILPICYDAKSMPFNNEQRFDRVLVDAPCTGTGTLKHNPEIKWRLSKSKILELASLQTHILSNCALLVGSKGRLIYSTCSLEYEENEAVVKEFLTNNQDFQIIKPDLPEFLITKEGFVRTWPHRDNMDGFFAAIMEKII